MYCERTNRYYYNLFFIVTLEAIQTIVDGSLKRVKEAVKAVEERSSKKSKSGSKLSKDDFVAFNATCVDFTLLPSYGDEFNDNEVEQIDRLIRGACEQMKEKASNRTKVSSTRRDELLVVQEVISSFSTGLCELLQARNKVLNVFYDTETAYSTQHPSAHPSSSSSAAPVSSDIDDVVNGRIDFTFHSRQCVDFCLGMIECKHSKLNVYNQRKKEKPQLNGEGKKALVQCFTQLLSKFDIFKRQGISIVSYVTLLTTGKKWFVVERQLCEGIPVLNYTTEVELMDKNWNILPDAVDKVIGMVKTFLITIEDVYSEVNKVKGKKRRRQVQIEKLNLFLFDNFIANFNSCLFVFA